MGKERIGLLWLVLYIATIPLANWTLAHFGILTIFGLAVPAGVFWVGLALVLRDLSQNQLGRWWIVGGIAVGATLSLLIAPAFAVASASAFLFSEMADWAVYTPLHDRGKWLTGVAVSGTVGAAVDSAIFLQLAFGSLAFFWGQFLVKTAISLLAVAVLYPIRQRRAVA
jgi:hypothetical protein